MSLAGFGIRVILWPEMHNLNSIMRISDVPKLRMTQQNNWPALFKSVKAMKEKGSQKKWAIIKATVLT